MDIKNVKISVDNLDELLTGENESEIIDIMRQALIKVRNSEGHYDVTKEIEKQKIEDPAKIAKMQREAPDKEEKLEKGLLNGDKFNMFRPSCFGKISYSHLSRTLKSYGYQVSQKGNCISDEKMVTVTFERLQELEEIEKKYSGNDSENKGETIMDSKKSVAEILAMGFVNKSADFKEQKMMSIRCASSVQDRLDSLVEKYPCFTKQYILSLLLDMSLTELGE
jgi:hypothetical protein